MEYYWGYAAATHSPLPNPFDGKPRPTRSNSSSTAVAPTTTATATKTNTTAAASSSRRPRFPGHTRAKSTDSGSSSTTRAAASEKPLDLHHHHHFRHRNPLQQFANRTGGGGDKRQPVAAPDSSSTQSLLVTTEFSGDDTGGGHSRSAWWQINSETAAALRASPARPASVSAPVSAPERASVLRKPAPGSPAGKPRRAHDVDPNHRQKQLPPVPRLDTPGLGLGLTRSGNDDNSSSPVAPASSYFQPPATVSFISPSIAALAVASGAALPLTPTSPTKASFSHRFSQHLSSSSPSSSAPHQSLNVLSAQVPPHSHPPQSHQLRHAAMSYDAPTLQRIGTTGVPISRAESASSASGTPSLSVRTMMSTDASSSGEGSSSRRPLGHGRGPTRPFVVRNGRTYIADPKIVYPLPVDLPELHRQSMRTLLLCELFGRPVCSPALAKKPPARVLDLGCGSGFWSMMCHRWYSQRGHPNISFTGLDVAPIPGASAWGDNGGSTSPGEPPSRPDKDMKWRFVQHDFTNQPWPFPDNEFDLVMMQNLSLGSPVESGPDLMDEIVRVLCPGGTIEIWESDHTIRMLRPHVPEGGGSGAGGDGSSGDEGSDDSSEEAAKLGAYVMTGSTPMSSPLNNFLVEYNSWLTKALDARHLTPVPCTNIEPMLVMEEALTGVGSRRLAVPFSEVKWEREGVGGVVTKDGKSYIESRGTKGLLLRGAGDDVAGGPGGGGGKQGKVLSAGQATLRRTALMTVVQMIQSLEPVLREASGKSQDEWDAWAGKMMNDLLRENGTSWGECLEVGAWWARKKGPPKKM